MSDRELKASAERWRPSPSVVPAASLSASESSPLHLTFDVLCAAIALVLLSPLLITIAIVIKLHNDGPVLYAQSRVGRNFRLFRLFKFRTMVQGADKAGLLTAAADSRVTTVGIVLRKYKLDELPQLFNVVKGDMQLVGSRPEVERYVEVFRQQYQLLLRERPGITDPAAIAFRTEDTMLTGDLEQQYISKVLPVKLQMSLDYQGKRCFTSDLKVLMRTIVTVFA